MARNALPGPSKTLSLRRRFAGGIAWGVVARVFSQGSTLVINLILANLLGRTTFGEYSIIYATILTVAAMSTLGVGSSATKYIAEFRLVDKERTARVLGLGSAMATATACISGGLLFFSAGSICNYILRAPHLTSGLRIASGAVVFAVLNSYIMGVLVGLEGFPALAFASICGAVILGTSCAIGGWLAGVNGAVVGVVLGGVSQWVALSLLVRRERARQLLGVTYRQLRREWELIWRYFIPAALSGFVSMPALWFANALLVRSPDGFNQVALYSVASSVRMCVLFFPQIVNGVGVSLINAQVGLRNVRDYRRTFWLNLALTALSALLGAGFAVVMGHQILSLFGNEFIDGKVALTILSATAVAEAVALATYQVIQSRGEMWRSLFFICVPRDATIIVLAYVLAARSGAIGVAWAYAIGIMVSLLSTVALASQLGVCPERIVGASLKSA